MKKPVPLNTAQKAARKASDGNRKRLFKALDRIGSATLAEFLSNNIGALDAHFKKKKKPPLSHSLADILTKLSSKDKAVQKKALFEMTRVAKNFVRTADLTFNDINARNIKFKRIKDETIKFRMDTKLALKREAKKYSIIAAKYAGKMLVTTSKIALLPHYFIKSIANGYAASASYFGISKIKRQAILAGTVAATTLANAIPVSAMSYPQLFLPNDLSGTIFHEACQDPRILNGSRLTAALATSIDTHDPRKMALLMTALEATDAGMSPLASFLISMKETMGGADVVATGSSAKGPRQSVDGTTLEWIKKYARNTTAYKTAKAHAESGNASAQERALVLAIDTTISNYSQQLITDVKNGRVPTYAFDAMNAAYSTVFGGQLFGQVLRAEAPYLSDESMDNMSMREAITAVGKYYAESHLLGSAGGPFLSYLVQHNPDIKMNDSAALKAAYRTFPDRNSAFAPNVGTYYVSVAKVNGLFKNGANTTAALYAQDITNFVSAWAQKTISGVSTQLAMGDSAFEICTKDKALLESLRSRTTNSFEIGLRTLGLWGSGDTMGARLLDTWGVSTQPNEDTPQITSEGTPAPEIPIPQPRPKFRTPTSGT